MEKIFGAPQYYVQGAGVLAKIDLYLETLGVGSKVLVIIDPGVLDSVKHMFSTLNVSKIPYQIVVYEDSIRLSRICELIKTIEPDFDCIIGVGGGRAIDVAKRVKWALGTRMISVPTSIASDASTSRSAVAYNELNEIVEDCPIFGPEGVLVDTQVIVGAPLRLFGAGMADALSKRFEYELSVKYDTKNWYNADPVFFLDNVSLQMHTLLLNEGLYLRDCFARHEVNETVEKAITAMLLMSRLIYDSGGLRGAHDMFEEFHDCGYGHQHLHGEIVGFFDLIQLIIEKYSTNKFEELYSLYKELGIPLRISEMGFNMQDKKKLEDLTYRMQVKCQKFNYTLSADAFQSALWYLENREKANA